MSAVVEGATTDPCLSPCPPSRHCSRSFPFSPPDIIKRIFPPGKNAFFQQKELEQIKSHAQIFSGLVLSNFWKVAFLLRLCLVIGAVLLLLSTVHVWDTLGAVVHHQCNKPIHNRRLLCRMPKDSQKAGRHKSLCLY